MKIKDIIFQIESITFQETLEYIFKNVKINEGQTKNNGKKLFLVTINPELVMLAKGDSYYEKVLKSANLAVCDGAGIVIAGKIFGKRFPERIHGVDLVQKLSEFVAKQPISGQKKPISVGFLGGRENVAQLTADCLKKKFPDLKIAFAKSEWDQVKDKKCDIIFVAFGSPKQEKWIYENLNKIDVKVAIGVGGSFDFISGKVKRAPVWVRRIGMEWLFRLIIQPWRIKRQLVLPKFVLLVIKERFL